ncbi:MAG: hypothetical protein R3E67_01770 [Pseudomonadales bacterium]
MVVARAFQLSGQPAAATATDAFQLTNGDWAVVHLLAINNAPLDINSAEYKAVQERMNASVGSNEYALYQQALRQAAKVEKKVATAVENQERVVSSSNRLY